jgi:Zn-dependent protease
VPADVRRLRGGRRDEVLVALAGPAANLLLAAASALVLPLLAGSGGLVAALQTAAVASIMVNCVLAVFNLLPVPPLDGGRVLAAVLPDAARGRMRWIESVGLVVVLVVVMKTGVLERLVHPLVGFFLQLAG